LYGSAYEKYLGFKRVVRDALGPGSKQYKRIHMRAAAAAADEGGEASEGAGAPAGGTPEAPTAP
jgi:hypothetical protein